MAEQSNTDKRAAVPGFAQLGEALIRDALGGALAKGASGGAGGGADGGAGGVVGGDGPESAMERLAGVLEHTQRLAALGTIAGMIAHEFNNILTPMMAYSQMALENPGDRELSKKALERAVAGSQRAAEIATAILGFSRDEFSVPRGTEVASADVEACVRQTLSCMARQPAQDGITLEVTIDLAVGGGPLMVAMRPVALQHVLLNLLLNARKAMNPGGGRLVVNARRLSGVATATGPQGGTGGVGGGTGGVGGMVEVTIEDTGRGIEAGRLGRIFEPHVSFDGAGAGVGAQDGPVGGGSGGRASAVECKDNVRLIGGSDGGEDISSSKALESGGAVSGFGLGLVVCKRLVEEVGGRLWIRSEVGRGTVVGFGCREVVGKGNLPQMNPDGPR